MSLTINGSGGGIPVGTPTIETGMYTGTGTTNETGACSLTFNGTPVFVFIRPEYVSYESTTPIVLFPLALSSTYEMFSYNELISGSVMNNQYYYAKIEGKTLSWYVKSSVSQATTHQANISGKTYYYMAITV